MADLRFTADGERDNARFALAALLTERGWDGPDDFAELALERIRFDEVRRSRDQAVASRNYVMQKEIDHTTDVRRLEQQLADARALIRELRANCGEIDRADIPALTAEGTRAAKGIKSKGAAWADGYRTGWSNARAGAAT